ncbi:DUF2726 domain-containing protein [Caldimonas tepidiphila]|uniref:DUF2726 domain-containing protein n=1 Tax=Caldimonas tepidiphila TaxID=2315841 RepID=UPI000E5BAE1E|nr:DUF2726 domain-containing protein [Caldimonas tepidiphila]
MNDIYFKLKDLLSDRDLTGFLSEFERLAPQSRPIGLSELTQRVFPVVLKSCLAEGTVTAEAIVHVWRLVRTGSLLIVDNELLEAVNARIEKAWWAARGPDAPPPEKLRLFQDDDMHLTARRYKRMESERPIPAGAVAMRRVVVASGYVVGMHPFSDALSFKKNVCASNQEREFLRAIRHFFPTLHAYPNMPMRNFVDVDGFVDRLSERHRIYARGAIVDVLLCTVDEDPLAVIELDSAHHDPEEARERDELKNDLLDMAGIPLVRIRPLDTHTVRCEDFYDLLVSQGEELDKLRPRRIAPRRTHDSLVPAEMDVYVSAG